MNIPFKDIADLDEDQRIETIGKFIMATKSRKTAFSIDCGKGDEGKGDRYIQKLTTKFPDIEVKHRTLDFPIENVETIVVGLK